MFNLESYYSLLKKFIDADYKFIFFDDFKSNVNGQLLLRHDVDQDCGYALELAKIENSLGVISTYFFLLRNDSYNLFSDKNREKIRMIKSLGHSISLHFDPLLYKNPEQGLLLEKSIFESIFNEKINIISFHRPPENFLGSKGKKLLNSPNTYEDRFFKEIEYFSDSRGEFRYGHPTDSKGFNEGKSIQLLIHPIWWVLKGKTNLEKIEGYKKHKIKLIDDNLAQNLDFYGEN